MFRRMIPLNTQRVGLAASRAEISLRYSPHQSPHPHACGFFPVFNTMDLG
jgi:hypothetical protein